MGLSVNHDPIQVRPPLQEPSHPPAFCGRGVQSYMVQLWATAPLHRRHLVPDRPAVYTIASPLRPLPVSFVPFPVHPRLLAPKGGSRYTGTPISTWHFCSAPHSHQPLLHCCPSPLSSITSPSAPSLSTVFTLPELHQVGDLTPRPWLPLFPGPQQPLVPCLCVGGGRPCPAATE